MKINTQLIKDALYTFSNKVLLLYVLAVGIVGGFISVPYVLSAIQSGDYLIGSVSVGAWITQPDYGTPHIDPYGLAGISQNGDVQLGKSEGIFLRAIKDSSGDLLRSSCTYEIGSIIPAARYWTLALYRPNGLKIEATYKRYSFSSTEIIYNEDGNFQITLSPKIHSGNWIPLKGHKSFEIILRLYDLPASLTSQALRKDLLPQIIKKGCLS